MSNPLERVPGQGDSRVDYLIAQLYRGSLVLQKSGVRGDNPPNPAYGKEFFTQSVTLREGSFVVYAKLNIINTKPTTDPKVSVTCELRVGTEVDNYEMLEIPGQSMRLASLIVGANLTAPSEAKISVRSSLPDAPMTPINIVNMVIASIQVNDLLLLRTT